MKVASFSLGPLGTNCYIVQHGSNCLIFDPSGESQVIIDYIEKEKLTPQAILLTHAHFDHIGALDVLRKEYNLSVYLHESESAWLENPTLNRSSLYFGEAEAIITTPPEKELQPGFLTIGAFKMTLLHTPGHSPGSMTFVFDNEKFIVSGDVLFPAGIGRTDLFGGDLEQLKDSILNKLYILPDDYIVLPGHNVQTSIGQEKKTNPYTLQF